MASRVIVKGFRFPQPTEAQRPCWLGPYKAQTGPLYYPVYILMDSGNIVSISLLQISLRVFNLFIIDCTYVLICGIRRVNVHTIQSIAKSINIRVWTSCWFTEPQTPWWPAPCPCCPHAMLYAPQGMLPSGLQSLQLWKRYIVLLPEHYRGLVSQRCMGKQKEIPLWDSKRGVRPFLLNL